MPDQLQSMPAEPALPSLQQLTQADRALCLHLSSPLPRPSYHPQHSKFKQVLLREKIDHTLDNMFGPNSWDEISQSIHQAKENLAFVAGRESEEDQDDRQHELAGLRLAVQRNKFKKYKLQLAKTRAQRECQEERRKLQRATDELERVEASLGRFRGQVQEMGGSGDVAEGEGMVFPSLESVVPSRFHDKYLSRISGQDPLCAPLSLFTGLSAQAMETDRKICFLKRKKLQQQQKLQQVKQQLAKTSAIKPEVLQQRLKQSEEWSSKLQAINNQISVVNSPSYVEGQISERARTMEQLYTIECEKLQMLIKKLVDFAKLTRNEQLIQEVDLVLSRAPLSP